MIPRRNEVDAVMGVLLAVDEEGHPAYDDEQAMSKAIVRALATELLQRELYAIVPQGAPHGYGPYWTRTEAERAWNKTLGAAEVGPAGLLRVFPWAPAEELAQSTKPCSCGHAAEQHVVKRDRRGKTSGPYECGACAASVKKGAANGCQRYEESAA